MSWFKKLLPKISTTDKKGVPEGVWSKCPACGAVIYQAELERNIKVCPKCGHHLRLTGRERLDLFVDPVGVEELATEVVAIDRLKFKDTRKYKERLSAAQKSTKEKEALVTYAAQLYGIPIIAVAFDFTFIGGSMSAAVGERFVIAVEAAYERSLPLICFSASGGARMQEGLFSLFQMAKTSAALARYQALGKPYVSVLCDPTMGGVSASFAMLGDLIIAEPKALIGFSGPRVIEQTIRETLPEGFQRSEFLLAHGAIDMIMDRREMRSGIAEILAKLQGMHKSQVPSDFSVTEE